MARLRTCTSARANLNMFRFCLTANGRGGAPGYWQFKHVDAPFAGVLTRRNVDIGALVNAGNGRSGKELFNLALIDPLRVYVSVPEADAPSIRAGMRAWIGLAEFPASRE